MASSLETLVFLFMRFRSLNCVSHCNLNITRRESRQLPVSASPLIRLFDTTGGSYYTARMEVHFTAEQEARLSKIATKEGVDPEELVKVAALRLLEDDTRFRAGVQKGIEQADRGEFVEEEEMDARVKRMFRS